MDSSLAGNVKTVLACSPKRTALGELTIPSQSASTGWPMFGPDSASEAGNVGPSARKWAEGLQRSVNTSLSSS